MPQQQHLPSRLLSCARPPQQPFGHVSPGKGGEITINATQADGRFESQDYYTHTDQTRAFQQVRRRQQQGGAGRVSLPLHRQFCGAALILSQSRMHDYTCPLSLLQEWAAAKSRQDQQLESIETGLGQLKEIGAAMNEELQRHDVLINEVGAGPGWVVLGAQRLRPNCAPLLPAA